MTRGKRFFRPIDCLTIFIAILALLASGVVVGIFALWAFNLVFEVEA